MIRIYVASSFRNEFQPTVVSLLRHLKFQVYDFKDGGGFEWSQIDSNWKEWSASEFIQKSKDPLVIKGFNTDMNALKACDICIMLMPCGNSAHLELGYAEGANKHTIVVLDQFKPCRPELMWNMADHIVIGIKEMSDLCIRLKGELE